MTDLERCVMEMLLAGERPGLMALRTQLSRATVARRVFTGCGFYTYFSVDRRAASPAEEKAIRLGNVEATIPGLENGAGFVLFINDGYLDNLEGYTYDEPWPGEVTSFELSFDSSS